MPNSQNLVHNMRFLVIDRDADVLSAVGKYLRMESAHSIRTVDTVLHGLEILGDSQAEIDCVICAHDVTPISGLEFLKNLRSGKYGDDPLLRGIKFIMLTAHREMALVQAAVKLDVTAYIAKPFDYLLFTRGIHHALAHRPALKPASEYGSVDISEANHLPVWLTPR